MTWDQSDSERLARLAELEERARMKQTLYGTDRKGDDGLIGGVQRLEEKLDRLTWWLTFGLVGVVAAQTIVNLVVR